MCLVINKIDRLVLEVRMYRLATTQSLYPCPIRSRIISCNQRLLFRTLVPEQRRLPESHRLSA